MLDGRDALDGVLVVELHPWPVGTSESEGRNVFHGRASGSTSGDDAIHIGNRDCVC